MEESTRVLAVMLTRRLSGWLTVTKRDEFEHEEEGV